MNLNPGEGIQINWLKCKYNHYVVKLNHFMTEAPEQQLLLDTCARIFLKIQELEFEQRLKQATHPQSIPSSTTD